MIFKELSDSIAKKIRNKDTMRKLLKDYRAIFIPLNLYQGKWLLDQLPPLLLHRALQPCEDP